MKIWPVLLLVASLAGCGGGCVHVPASNVAEESEEDSKLADRKAEACSSIKRGIEESAERMMKENPVRLGNVFNHCDVQVGNDGRLFGIYYVTTVVIGADGGYEMEGGFIFVESKDSYGITYTRFSEKPLELPSELSPQVAPTGEGPRVLEL